MATDRNNEQSMIGEESGRVFDSANTPETLEPHNRPHHEKQHMSQKWDRHTNNPSMQQRFDRPRFSATGLAAKSAVLGPKKGGAGGKGTWGAVGSEADVDWDPSKLDPRDPNYEDNSDLSLSRDNGGGGGNAMDIFKTQSRKMNETGTGLPTEIERETLERSVKPTAPETLTTLGSNIDVSASGFGK